MSTATTTAAQRREAERWTGSVVRIRSNNSGHIHVPSVACHNRKVATTGSYHGSSQFLVEAIPDMPGVVAFRLTNNNLHSNLYLTNIMYGDENRQNVASALAEVPGILADNIGLIVDYGVGRPTAAGNFEGAGYNYNPMTVQRGPPNKLQMFRLEPGIGVRSLFGTYWRSEWWNKVVSQSPHLAGDEMWHFERVVVAGGGGGGGETLDSDSDDSSYVGDRSDADSESDMDNEENEDEEQSDEQEDDNMDDEE